MSNNMIISLIGMSNTGKTFWAKKLETAGFLRFSSDDYIEEKLGNKLKRLGYSGIHDVSKWLGQPYEERHAKNSKIYLKYEKESLLNFIQFIRNNPDKHIIIDTTGSVIYTGDKILRYLRKYTRVIYLDTSSSVKEEMYKSYTNNPKPVLWGNIYEKKNGESDLESLKCCYPKLLLYRSQKYQELAHVTLMYYLLHTPKFSMTQFLELIQK